MCQTSKNGTNKSWQAETYPRWSVLRELHVNDPVPRLVADALNVLQVKSSPRGTRGILELDQAHVFILGVDGPDAGCVQRVLRHYLVIIIYVHVNSTQCRLNASRYAAAGPPTGLRLQSCEYVLGRRQSSRTKCLEDSKRSSLGQPLDQKLPDVPQTGLLRYGSRPKQCNVASASDHRSCRLATAQLGPKHQNWHCGICTKPNRTQHAPVCVDSAQSWAFSSCSRSSHTPHS